jgi:hypothetical protein
MTEVGARVATTVVAAIAAVILTLSAPAQHDRRANGWTFGPGLAFAASPDASGEPSPGASAAPGDGSGGDTRSAGEGPGLVGAPFLAIGGVVLLGLAAAAATLFYVRATGGPRSPTGLR